MALINCPDCKHRVSDQAISCPNCGYPLRKTETMTHSVSQIGSVATIGWDELQDLKVQGWRVVDEDEDWYTDGDGATNAQKQSTDCRGHRLI